MTGPTTTRDEKIHRILDRAGIPRTTRTFGGATLDYGLDGRVQLLAVRNDEARDALRSLGDTVTDLAPELAPEVREACDVLAPRDAPRAALRTEAARILKDQLRDLAATSPDTAKRLPHLLELVDSISTAAPPEYRATPETTEKTA